jgi:hypothetical protein
MISPCSEVLVGFACLKPLTSRDEKWREGLCLKNADELRQCIAIQLLLVDPDRTRKHIGRMLLRRAITTIQIKRRKRAVASIPKGLSPATDLCLSEGGSMSPGPPEDSRNYYRF